jgi:cyclopropane-fatty-acyl-phospholipid synthase
VSNSKKIIEEHLQGSGVRINGNQPWDIQVKDERLYDRVLRDRSLGLGEAYMDGWFDTLQLDEMICRLVKVYSEYVPRMKDIWFGLCAMLFNRQSKSRAFEVGEKHYDLGNDLFELMLDKRMTYSCGYWKCAKSLDEAQEAKLDLICRKIGVKRGDKILDIGCGWGSFAGFAAEKYGAEIVGITVSKEQAEMTQKKYARLPIEIRFQDYRNLKGEKFDHIVSVGQMEHVGAKNYRKYMQIVHDCLKDEGLFLLHTIGNTVSRTKGEPWMDKYIFPNGMLPSPVQLSQASEGLFILEDWHNFSADYDRTLMAWFHNFDQNWSKIKSKYGERFYRMWRYYLLSCAGAFRARQMQLWQIVYSIHGVAGGYQSIR